jgi:peptidyl-prolyl cis-trans isomerase D
MMDWLRKYKTAILIVVVGGFIISTFVGFGLYLRQGGGFTDSVADVNGEQIPYRQYLSLYNQVVSNRREHNEQLTPEVLGQIRQEVVQSLIQQTVFYQEAQRYGIQVSDEDLAQSLASIPAFRKDGRFDPQTYVQTLHFSLHTTPEDFEDAQKKQIAISRLRFLVLQGIKISDAELELEYQDALRVLKGSDREKFLKDFAKNREPLREKIRQDKAAQVLNRWYQQLGSNLKVKVRLDEIENRVRRG